MAEGYCAYLAAITIARHPQAQALALEALPDQLVSVGFIPKKDGTKHTFDFNHSLQMASTSPYVLGELPRVWLAGSLLTLGDALSRDKYFDHAPVLELVYHLRNAIAHGNHFSFTSKGLQRLENHPAHNRDALFKGEEIFEITPALEGQPVLFNYLGPGDVLEILSSVGSHLFRIGNGDADPVFRWPSPSE